jgi:hypothetical protein
MSHPTPSRSPQRGTWTCSCGTTQSTSSASRQASPLKSSLPSA